MKLGAHRECVFPQKAGFHDVLVMLPKAIRQFYTDVILYFVFLILNLDKGRCLLRNKRII